MCSIHKCFPYFEAKFNVNMLLMNISHLEYRKTYPTHTWTNISMAMTNHSRIRRQKGWWSGSMSLGSTTYPTLLRCQVGALPCKLVEVRRQVNK
jgi:hypothetical protein